MRNKIIVFCCENSSLMAAKNIGAGNVLLDAVEIINVPCSGKVETGVVLKCLENGAPAVLIMACPKDNCKFISGNRRMEKRIGMIKKDLTSAGINEQRVHMDFLSSVDSHKFVEIVEEMMKKLSPEE